MNDLIIVKVLLGITSLAAISLGVLMLTNSLDVPSSAHKIQEIQDQNKPNPEVLRIQKELEAID